MFLFPVFTFASQDVPHTIASISNEYGVDPQMSLFLTWKESQWYNGAVGDGHLICKRTGKPIRSRGVWQINNCAHPNITDEQAFDVEWSTHWAMKEIKKNGCGIWSTCKMLGNAT